MISVAAHVCGRELRSILDAFARGDVAHAAAQNARISPIVAGLFGTTSPIPLKWALRRMGFAVGECRSPLGVMPESLAITLEPLLAPYIERARSLTPAT